MVIKHTAEEQEITCDETMSLVGFSFSFFPDIVAEACTHPHPASAHPAQPLGGAAPPGQCGHLQQSTWTLPFLRVHHPPPRTLHPGWNASSL